MSTDFSPQYISFKMKGRILILDNLTIHKNPNTKWVRFCGTPCSIDSMLWKISPPKKGKLKALSKHPELIIKWPTKLKT